MNRELHVRHERVAIRARQGARLLYASDLHLGWPWTRCVPNQVLDAVRATRPDALLLGGDLCDGVRSLARLAELVRAARELTHVLAVPGNHDLRLGGERVRDVVTSAGGTWLVEDDHRIGAIVIEGRARKLGPLAVPRSETTRVLCAHRPAIVAAARRARFDVVLAGHLHGGQLVLFERGGRLYPYAWLDRWNGPRFDLDGTTMLVSRGAGDALPLRFRCPREVVLCELAGTSDA
ncbi:MAG: metallophosphoesterase family protein [Planctomycetes bacterium]|nr:metallophosphoesterase family protein [Planctomycetota bacterium]